MKIDKSTVCFISLLNEFADRLLDEERGIIMPFQELDGELLECCRKSYCPAEKRIFYDNDNPSVVGSCVYYPVVQQAVVDADHKDIVSVYEHFYVCMDSDDGNTVSLIASMEGTLRDSLAGEDSLVVINKGFWYVC